MPRTDAAQTAGAVSARRARASAATAVEPQPPLLWCRLRLMLKTLAAAEKVARYRHAQLSAVRLAGDINAGNNDDVTLDELLVIIKAKW
jgi:hypothetical protein